MALESRYDERVKRSRERLEKLLASPKFVIGNVAKDAVNHSAFGVYVISTPDGARIVYAGKTNTKTIAGRMYDHLFIGTSSDLGGMLKLNPTLPQNKHEYVVQYSIIPEKRDRTIFEHFVISILDPPLNK